MSFGIKGITSRYFRVKYVHCVIGFSIFKGSFVFKTAVFVVDRGYFSVLLKVILCNLKLGFQRFDKRLYLVLVRLYKHGGKIVHAVSVSV